MRLYYIELIAWHGMTRTVSHNVLLYSFLLLFPSLNYNALYKFIKSHLVCLLLHFIRLAERGNSARYSIATEHEHSCCVLLARYAHIISHHITSHHITSYNNTSHHITSHHITSHHITSHHITSHHITSHHIT